MNSKFRNLALLSAFSTGVGLMTYMLYTSYADVSVRAHSPCKTTGEQEYIRRRLKAAGSNWQQANEKRDRAVLGINLEGGVATNRKATIWDFFYPSFDCPYTKSRIGRFGDGGKWVCGFEEVLVQKSACMVYSFGVNDDTSFEEEILQRTKNCTVRMFDPTVHQEPAVVRKYPGRAFFYAFGISAYDASQEKKKKLKSIMAETGDVFLDILKMDVEGAEWQSIAEVIKDFPDQLPFAQLLLEIHLHVFHESYWIKILAPFWKNLEKAGLREFFQEPNLLNSKRIEFRELAFLNTKVKPFQY